jgi:hypothetical protein
MTGRRSDRAWLLAALGLYSALNVWVISTRHYWPRYDSGVYISAATALSRGIGLRDITSPVTRPSDSWTHIPTWVRRSPAAMERPDWPFFSQYPPLLPLLLSPLVALGGGRFVVLQLAPLAAGIATLVLVYRWRDTLFPGPWPLTLIVTAGSALTLYASRVQSETLQSTVVLVTLVVLARAGEDPARLLRWSILAALVLLAGIAIHIKLVFFAAGATLWLVVGPRAPICRRVGAAAALAVLTVAPPLVFTFSASWAGRPGLPFGEAEYTLSRNPYYWSGSWYPSPFVGRATLVDVVASRAATTGRFLWDGVSAGPLTAGRDLVALAVLALGALFALPWWRHHRGLLALPTVLFVAGIVLSPWAESRMVVPVLPLVAHALAVAFARVPSLLGVPGRRAMRQTLIAAGALVLAAQLGHWRKLTPQWDEYALEFWQHGGTLALARVAAELPPDRPLIAPVDNAAFALVTGRATQSFSPGEWKTSDPRILLASGGAPIALGPLVPAQFLTNAVALGGELATLAGRRTRQLVLLGEYGLAIEWVQAPPPPPGSVRPESFVPGRIHPRWLRMTPADREPLARTTIPTASR